MFEGHPQNVLFLLVDSLRADAVPGKMPELSRLSGGGIEFTQAIATGPATSEASMGLVTSRYYSDVDGVGLPASEFRTLAESVPDSYHTHGMTTNPLTSAYYNYDRGYDTYVVPETGPLKKLAMRVRDFVDSESRLSRMLASALDLVRSTSEDTQYEPQYKSAAAVNESITDAIERTEDPVFTFGHYMDVHHPYEPPSEYLPDGIDRQTAQELSWELDGLTLEEIEARASDLGIERDPVALLESLYEAACRYFDDQLAELLDTLPEDTLTVVVGDHGDLFHDHGLFGHPQEMWDRLVRVPFVIHHPEIEPRQIDEQQSMIDFAPTVLDLLDEPVPRAMRGTPIERADPDERPYAVGLAHSPDVSAMCRGTEFKWVRHRISPLSGLSGRDHGEMLFETGDESVGAGTELADQRSDVVDELSGRFADEIYSEATAAGAEYDDDQVKEHLEDLGYA